MDNFTNPENNTQNTVDTYSQPGALTGESANWQSSNQTSQDAVYTDTYANDFVDPSVGYTAEPEKKPMIGIAITSLVLGILSIIFCCLGLGWITAIPGVIFGIIAIAKKYAGKGCAIAGIICSSIAIVSAIVSLIITIAFGASMPSFIEGFEDGFSSTYDDYYDDYDYYY